METSARSTELNDQLKAHSLSWAGAIDSLGYEPRLAPILDEPTAIIGDEVPALASGSLSHNVDHGQREFDDSGDLIFPDQPNLYDVIVVTDRLFILTWGHLRKGSASAERELTTVRARKNISQVTIEITPGQERYPGGIATHHDVSLTFVDGSKLKIPNAEEDLTPAGIAALSALIPEFYADMSA
ncbi:hypothetical protein [Paenarthrobacter aurescens]|uniref:hypothetical protein n=1 Tax=Paenarthrobacter aurescens TaxID=43663 RepID=UPI0021BE09F9|nr:hypothetical protein [Paenarthrobacter aurescens]MCT9871756.1 hypothetical protein [Paenarthrobacter aurescens]